MKQKIVIGLLLCAMLCMGSAQAVSAQWCDEGICVYWNECSGSGVLTVYKDNWPIQVLNVNCAAGSCVVPVYGAQGSGRYSVRLRAGGTCEKAAVTDTSLSAPTVAPTAVSTPISTTAPTAQPTVQPTARPTIKPAETGVSASGTQDGSLAAQVIAIVNEDRKAAGLNALTEDADLTAAACVRAKEIVEQFSHTRPDGSSWSTVSGKAYGENIAKGHRTAERVMAAWMSSSTGHRENILRASYGSIGVCAWVENGIVYWVQLFGK